jgi:hypothetical protein
MGSAFEMFGCRYEDEPAEPEIEVRNQFCFLEESDELNIYGPLPPSKQLINILAE